MSLHPGHHLTWTKRFRHVIIGAQAQAADLVDIILFGGNHDDGRILDFPEPFADFKSIHARKHEVQDQKIKIFIQGPLQAHISLLLQFYFKTA